MENLLKDNIKEFFTLLGCTTTDSSPSGPLQLWSVVLSMELLVHLAGRAVWDPGHLPLLLPMPKPNTAYRAKINENSSTHLNNSYCCLLKPEKIKPEKE